LDAIVRWTQGLQFVGNGKSEHGVLIDADPDVGGLDLAARPLELMVLALCGCTAMDVVSVLNKMRVHYTRFEVGAASERANEYPKIFKSIELVYQIWGDDIEEEKLVKAINLSMERYCPIANTLKKTVKLTYRYHINPKKALSTGGAS